MHSHVNHGGICAKRWVSNSLETFKLNDIYHKNFQRTKSCCIESNCKVNLMHYDKRKIHSGTEKFQQLLLLLYKGAKSTGIGCGIN